MKKSRSLLNYLLSLGLLMFILIFLFWNTSGLTGNDLNQGGKAYYDYAPDGQYKAMLVFFYDERPFQFVLDKGGEAIYIARLWSEEDAPRKSPLWMSSENEYVDSYNYVSMSYMVDIPLPVPFYERWYTWLFMTVRNVDLDKLEMVPR
ncbi:hypothetical protein OPW33_22875 [Vibrio europaeus]|uniref:hypothetical protein n=1 Tax=Vibrio europaeus TaxID=300876 RepID=UPI00233FD820|nr:hypothetical protein [Vibrio europaeus]MDC5842175.1 hypothetical protein [Vibrio europaeus]